VRRSIDGGILYKIAVDERLVFLHTAAMLNAHTEEKQMTARNEFLTQAIHDAGRMAGEIEKLKAENARLREALEQIEQADHPEYPYFRSGTEAMFADHLIGVARAALTTK
jgi:hypothetical protein